MQPSHPTDNVAEHRQRLEGWLDMLQKGMAFPGDVALVVQECLAETGDPTFFLDAPAHVRSELLRGLRRFRKTGTFEILYIKASRGRDISSQALAAIDTLVRAGLLSPDAALIEIPRPLFRGLDHIQNVQPLMALAVNDQGPVSARLVSLGIQPVGAYEYPQVAKLSIQIERSRREQHDNGSHEDTPITCSVAHLLLHRFGEIVFGPSFQLEYLVTFAIEPARRGRRTGFEVNLDFSMFEGHVFCESIALEGIDSLPCIEPT